MTATTTISESNSNSNSNPNANCYQLKWHSFNDHLYSSVAKSLNSDAFTDVTLFTTDGYQMNAHRFVLSAFSQYLQHVFSLHKTQSHLIVILPPDITFPTLKILIEYMYCGETTVSNDILDNVLRGGDLLKIRGLWRQPEPTATTPPPSLIQRAPKRSQSPQLQAQTSRATQSVIENKKNSNSCTNLPPPPPLLKRSKDGTYLEECSTITKISNTTTTTAVNEMQELEMDAAEYLVIKEEPNDFEDGETNEDFDPGYDEIIPESNTFIPDENVAEEGEVMNPNNGDSVHSCKNGTGNEENGGGETLYTPLTCELCSETFTLPRDWVRHVETYHGDQSNSHSNNNNHCGAKRLKRESTQKEDGEIFTPLVCDLCQKSFMTPQDWVRHIQNFHTDYELAMCNNISSTKVRQNMIPKSQLLEKTCEICNKKFPSHASMLIHKRTHTGERPFVCELCQKGFNVKSNLLRHLRTLHDKILNYPSPNHSSSS